MIYIYIYIYSNNYIYIYICVCVGGSNGKLPQELAQDVVCQSHTGHMTGLWFLPTRPLRLNINEWICVCGPGSSVGIATELGTGLSGIGVRDFPPVQTGPGAHPTSCKMGTGSFPVVKCGRGMLLTTHPLLVPRSWKSRAITLPTLWATSGL